MTTEEAQRASPEALLALAKKEGRGKLKIFLGAAPGVGKTFAMLASARAAKADWRDVVVGLVETHGRIETETLLKDLEILPRTIPDRVFEEADEIVLVDLPPDELLKRLSEGKVYVPDAAARAIENFFKPQNLTALRELALRRAAERIDADLVERMQAQAIEGPWPAGERILACVGADPISPIVVRNAKRLSDLMNAPWLA